MVLYTLFFFLYFTTVFGGKAHLSADYTLEWTLDSAAQTMNFNVTVKKLQGWIGIGFHPVGSSTNQAMVSADTIIATFDAGKAVVTDYYSITFTNPDTDLDLGGTDDVLDPSGSRENGVTNFLFKRKLVTGDQFDTPFTVGPMRVIWAIGTSDVLGYHGRDPNNRGTAIIDLFDDDVCGHTQGCKSCLNHTNCVYCGGDGLCYDRSNTGSCLPLNTTCTEQCTNGLLNAWVPLDFCASVWTRGLSRPRGLVVASNGDVLVLEAGRNLVTVHWNDSGVIQSNPLASASGINHGIAIRGAYLYASSPTTVYRWRYIAGQRNPLTDTQTVVTGVPCCHHVTRTIVFDSFGFLYVQVGSRSNVDPDTTHTQIRRFNVSALPGGGISWNSGVLFASGLRNEVGLSFDNTGRLWGVENGVDNLNRPDLGGDIHNTNPSEEVNLFDTAGKFYGYPYCWTEYDLPVHGKGRGTQWVQPNFMNTPPYNDNWCRNTSNVVVPKWNLAAHQAPLDIQFYYGTTFPTKYKGGAFVTLHGSWNRQPPLGFKIVYLTFQNGVPVAEEDFLRYNGAGAVWPNNVRPVSIAFTSCGNPAKDCMLVTSDASGEIIQISFTG